MKDFHRVVFKGPSFKDVFAQAHAHLTEAKMLDLAGQIAAVNPRKPPQISDSGFTELFWGPLDPWPHNEGHTHYIRVKWYG